MAKSRWARKRLTKGELHFILATSIFDETSGAEDFDEAEMLRITRKEAAKPLLLLPAE